jgi:alpha-L-rhamnosidase
MYDILFKETYPSWFYSINQGATTMWERWNSYTRKDGFNKGGMNSFNHYAYGAIGRWMYERIGGIKPLAPGYKRVEVAPMPGGSLTFARTMYQSPYGTLSSSWKLKEDEFDLEVKIPPQTQTIVGIPKADRTIEKIFVNGNCVWNKGEITKKDTRINYKNENTNYIKFDVASGTWNIKAIYQ